MLSVTTACATRLASPTISRPEKPAVSATTETHSASLSCASLSGPAQSVEGGGGDDGDDDSPAAPTADDVSGAASAAPSLLLLGWVLAYS